VMKVIKHGLVDKKIQCPLCKCIFQLKKEDALQQGEVPVYCLGDKDFFVKCPECDNDVVVVEQRFVPVWPRGSGSLGYTHVNVAL